MEGTGGLHQIGEKALSQHWLHAVVFQCSPQERNPLCCTQAWLIPCSRSLPHRRAAAAPLAPSPQVTPVHPSLTAAGEQTVLSPWAPLWGTRPLQPPFSFPPACFIRFLPYFSGQEQPPSLKLPSLRRSQLFFLSFSASYFPGAKYNKEFTVIDLELGRALHSCFVLCQQNAPWLVPGLPPISAHPFPWGHHIRMPARLASATRDGVSWSRRG